MTTSLTHSDYRCSFGINTKKLLGNRYLVDFERVVKRYLPAI
jgi:hypothetical protein